MLELNHSQAVISLPKMLGHGAKGNCLPGCYEKCFVSRAYSASRARGVLKVIAKRKNLWATGA